MCSLTPMFPNKQQEWYYASSTMEYPWMSQVESLFPTTHHLPSFLYPSFFQHDEIKNDHNITLHHHSMTLNHSNGTNTNGLKDEQEDEGTVLEKKISHNASERDRRRKLNALYSSLRALLPPSDQKKKLSIPMTVDKVVKYIPEQRQELQHLSQKKKDLLKRISNKTSTLNHHHHQEQLRNITSSIDSSSEQITTNWFTDTEIVVQIVTSKWVSISDMLLRLEENKLNVINIYSSVSSIARNFYTLHLQMKEDCRVRFEELNGMLLGLCKSY